MTEVKSSKEKMGIDLTTEGARSQSPLDEASLLKKLTDKVRDQEDLERDISQQANLALIEREDDRDQKRIQKLKATKKKLEAQRESQTRRQRSGPNFNNFAANRIRAEIERIDSEIRAIDDDINDFETRIVERNQQAQESVSHDEKTNNTGRLRNESQRDFLIRTGKITPFTRISTAVDDAEGGLAEAMRDAEFEEEFGDARANGVSESHQNLSLPGFMNSSRGSRHPKAAVEEEFSLRSRKKRRLSALNQHSDASIQDDASPANATSSTVSSEIESSTPLGTDNDQDEEINGLTHRKSRRERSIAAHDDLMGIDDGNEAMYQTRLRSWVERRSRERQNRRMAGELENANSHDEEWHQPCPDVADHTYESGLKMPGDVYPALFDYQKTGVEWLSELYAQQVGGIIGDEMGLGKTIQIIAFIAGLHYSKKLTGPVIVVAPATVLRQWVNEFHRWWPPLRVSILHSSGSGITGSKHKGRIEDEDFESRNLSARKSTNKSPKAAQRVVDRVVQQGHVLVTSYSGLQSYSDLIIDVNWCYAVLDEGHKIRNPNTSITIHCKELRTPNRIILSGTPMQNNLIELWSVFDFVYPMRLGTLVNFRNQFEIPIKLGGYSNATNLQILTATKCAETLKDAISPYLIQRYKADVASDLPKKTEQVLFCYLTKPQREAYEVFLKSDDMNSILNGSRQALYGIDILRKICNHPDLLEPSLRDKAGYKWGNPNKSGKMIIVKTLLEMWKNKGDKILLFSQGRLMLNVIENYVNKLGDIKYLRMDGTTNIKDRQSMVDRFNNDPEISLFLLTTKVGGLGVNLTGANRVIIFDPDWNPSTDVQARERAWRLGQKKEVTIYRLMVSGSIEEKMYHRQIFKQFLADKVLKDPKQIQTFHLKDLHDLFTLGNPSDGHTETGELFKGSEVRLNKSGPVDNRKISPQASGWKENAQLPPMKTLADAAKHRQPKTLVPITRSGTEAENEEVRGITGVAGLEDFHDNDEHPIDEDSRIMNGILAGSGVQTILQHDHIVSGNKIQADRGTIEREAKRIASRAASDLRKAAETARIVPIGTVTWTGEVGEAGRPSERRRWRSGGLTSTNVLANLAQRQGATTSGRNSMLDGQSAGTASKAEDFARLIVEYITLHGGSVPTQMLVVHFNPMCRNDREVEAFRASLREVAVQGPSDPGRRRGRWEVKDEFKKPSV